MSLKEYLISAPVLHFPSFDLPFVLDTDASNAGLGAVLSQNVHGTECVVAYASRVLTKSERSYCATRKELLALVWAVQHFRPYLSGRPFTVRTDHNSLKWLQNFKDAEGQVARWLEKLSEYQMCVEHRPGKKHGNADALSRSKCRQCGHSFKPNKPSVNALTENLEASNWAPTWSLEELRAEQNKDCDLHTVISWLTSDLVPPDFPKQSSYTVQTLWNQRNSLVLDQGVLFRQWEDIPNGGHQPTLQLLVPCKLIPSILEALHDHAMAGHLGIAKTLKKIQQRFYWPGQRRMVEDWCKACKACATRKSQPKRRRAPLQSEGSGLPMQRIAMDILGPLPETEQQNKYILVISDYFTKWTESFPMKNMEAKTVAEQLISNFICRFGVPYYIHTDQGRNFESSLISEMCHSLGMTKTRTTPYHPQSDGLVERFNRTLLNMLSIFCKDNETTWDLQLPYVMMAYRTSVQESTGATPFSLMFGREAKLPVDIMYGQPPNTLALSASEYSLQLRRHLEHSYHLVRDHLNLQQKRQKNLYDKRCYGVPYKQEDLVWVHFPAVPRGRTPKFHCPWRGPYRVKKVINDVLYRLQLVDGPCRNIIIHFDRLKPYHPDESRTKEIVSDPKTDSSVPLPATSPAHPSEEEEEEFFIVSPRPDVQQFLRRSTRQTRPPDRYGEFVTHGLSTRT